MPEFIAGAFTAICALLVVGSTGFWLLLLAAAFLTIKCLANENGWGATITLLMTAVALNLFSGIPIFRLIGEHPFYALMAAVAYFVPIGVLYAWTRWRMFAGDCRLKYDELKTAYLAKFKIAPDRVATYQLTPEQKVEWKSKWNSSYRASGSYEGESKVFTISEDDPTPNPLEYKATILMWLGHWPLSGLWFLLNNFVRRIMKAAWEQMKASLFRAARAAFKGAEGDALTADDQKMLDETRSARSGSGRRDDDEDFGGSRQGHRGGVSK